MKKNKILTVAFITLIISIFGFSPTYGEVTIYDKIACKAFAVDDGFLSSLYRYHRCINEKPTIEQFDEFAKLSEEVITKPYGTSGERVINEVFARKWAKEHLNK